MNWSITTPPCSTSRNTSPTASTPPTPVTSSWRPRSPAPCSSPQGTVALPGGSSATLSATGTATLTTGSAAGSFTAAVAYSGDNSFLPAGQTVAFSIARAATTTLLRAQPLAGEISTVVALSAAVSNMAGRPAEASLSFFDGPVLLGTVALQPDGSALLTTAKLSAGVHTFTAAYAGSGNFLPSNSPALPLKVAFTSTTLGLSTPALSYRTGAPITLTASLAPASLTGVISFLDGTHSHRPGSAEQRHRRADRQRARQRQPHRDPRASAGDNATSPAQSPALTFTVAPAPSTLTLAPLPATAVFGSSFTLTASIAPADASGQVTFMDAGRPIGQASFSNGTASVSVNKPAVGTHSFAASYPGDFATQPAVSAAGSFTVTRRPHSAYALQQRHHNHFRKHFTPTLTATLTPLNASGSVTFTDALTGASFFASLSNGVAGIALPGLTLGTHTFTAAYAGDQNDAPATSPAVSILVTPAVSSIVLAPLPASLTVVDTVLLNAAITPANASGTVLFRDAAAGVLGQATVRQGSAALTLSSLPAAAYSITAVYSGDAQDLPATSAAVATQVSLLPSSLALSGPASSPVGAEVTLTAAATPAGLDGLVAFTDNGLPAGSVLLANGVAVLRTSSLGVGAHSLRAGFPGDATHSSRELRRVHPQHHPG